MKSLIPLFAAAALTACAALAGCQSNPSNTDRSADNGQPPSSVGNGQTRNNGPFAPDSHPRPATNPSY